MYRQGFNINWVYYKDIWQLNIELVTKLNIVIHFNEFNDFFWCLTVRAPDMADE